MLPVNRQTLTAKYQSAMRLQATGKLTAATEAYHALLKLVPDQPEVHFQLARITQMQGDKAQAADHINTALAKKPDEVPLLQMAAELNADINNIPAARAAHDRLIALHPGALKQQADLAHFLQLSGDTEGADKLFRRLIKKHPYEGSLYRMFMGTAKLKPGDPLIRSMQKAITHPRMSEAGKIQLGFALAKAMEDTGHADKVFSYLNLANSLQSKGFPFDPDSRDAELHAALAAQETPQEQLPEPGTPTPVFVTGMPRSGTTLVERILSGHSDIVAGGENPYGLRIASQMFGLGPGMTSLGDVPLSDLQKFSSAYRRTIAWRAAQGNAAFVTDKAITSYLIFGYLTAAMSDAKLIVVQRDPKDMALSIYKNYFQDGTHRYSTDLAEIAGQIKAFRKAIDVWKTRMPGRIHEVHYEDLVTDPEAKARELIAAVGLEWDPACLQTDRADGQIKTLSVAQARKPINQGSKAAWKKYEAEMAPFIAAWEAD